MNDKEKVALGSIAASAGLTAAKAIIGLTTGSLAILSEAGHSLLDFSATVLTYFAVRISGKPADADHQYGHGKVESVTALAETALLFLLTGVVIWEAVQRLIGAQTHMVEATLAAFAIIAGSIVVDFFRARTLRRVAKKTSSEALEAQRRCRTENSPRCWSVRCGPATTAHSRLLRSSPSWSSWRRR